MTARVLTAAALLCGLAAPALAGTAAAQIITNPTSAAPAATAAAKPAPATAADPGYAAPAVNGAPQAPVAEGDMPKVPEMVPSPPAQPQAASPRPVQPMQSPNVGTSAGNLIQTIFALLLVLGLLAGLAWFMKRYGPKAVGGPANLRLVGALNLGGRERIMVVEVGDQWIVVGASPGRVNALATMPKQHGPEHAAILHPNPAPAGGFADWLKQTIDKRNAR
ncbi:flagellar biosynthetic protein FliO [Massilia cavernae]|uniref:Flagellar protein n=1 Tax=Massilia cavernae TaxID=2320864 RepID=A0A418XSL1_9BURK|nr:flagellar biosynthetic protein FliO [Massilia cavernae]RJG15580.1 flagellar biosynthetic protein FliO [Massilia cavernae]